MLAHTRIDPRTLHPRCTEAHLDVLARVAHDLRTGEITRANLNEQGLMLEQQPQDIKLFNINSWDSPYACGTAHCIGGWCDHYLEELGTSPVSFIDFVGVDLCPQFNELFYPLWETRKDLSKHELSAKFWNAITPAQAAEAIENVLYRGGWPLWKQVLCIEAEAAIKKG